MQPNTQGFKILGFGALFLIAWLYPYLPAHDLNYCAVKLMTGFGCPGCGMSRAFAAIMHGDVSGALGFNPMSVPLFLVFLYFWLKSLIEFVTRKRLGSMVSPPTFGFLSIVFVAGLFIQWFVRMFI